MLTNGDARCDESAVGLYEDFEVLWRHFPDDVLPELSEAES